MNGKGEDEGSTNTNTPPPSPPPPPPLPYFENKDTAKTGFCPRRVLLAILPVQKRILHKTFKTETQAAPWPAYRKARGLLLRNNIVSISKTVGWHVETQFTRSDFAARLQFHPKTVEEIRADVDIMGQASLNSRAEQLYSCHERELLL